MGRLAFLLACVLVVLGAGNSMGTVHTIEVMEWTFDPPNVTISPGDTVRWISVSGSFQVLSPPQSPKQWISPVLDEPGEFFDVQLTHNDGPGPFPFTAEPDDGSMLGSIVTADTCWATGDVNGDGIVLTVSDMVYLVRVLNRDLPWPENLYQLDLNGDCIIDGGDLYLLNLYFEQGLSVFPVYPIPTCCHPDTVVGACCIEDSCSVRAPIHCDSLGGEYLGHGTSCPLDNNPCVCCVGTTGNVDGDPGDAVNVNDLTRYVCWIWGICAPPPCLEEADLNADGSIDITDITYLVAYLFGDGAPPAMCP